MRQNDNIFDLEKITDDLQDILSPGSIYTDEPLSRHTTFKIGGPAKLFLLVQNTDELASLMEYISANRLPYFVLGNGSNVLAPDEGYDGIIIRLTGEFNEMTVNENINNGTAEVIAGAGAFLTRLSMFALKEGFTGLEFAHGIPGSVGGGVYMNAGAYGREMKDVVTCVEAVTSAGEKVYYNPEQLDFSYRSSRFRKGSDIICRVHFELKVYPRIPIRISMDAYKKARIEKQPLDMPSAGSTFKRPEGFFAGKLIEDSGLKGCKVGGAEVSEKHAGFIVNKGDATAQDVIQLIEHVQKVVNDKWGVLLEPEVIILK